MRGKNYLQARAGCHDAQTSADVSNLDSKIWNQHVVVHNGETGDEYGCDIIIFEDDPEKRHVIAFNNN